MFWYTLLFVANMAWVIFVELDYRCKSLTFWFSIGRNFLYKKEFWSHTLLQKGIRFRWHPIRSLDEHPCWPYNKNLESSMISKYCAPLKKNTNQFPQPKMPPDQDPAKTCFCSTPAGPGCRVNEACAPTSHLHLKHIFPLRKHQEESSTMTDNAPDRVVLSQATTLGVNLLIPMFHTEASNPQPKSHTWHQEPTAKLQLTNIYICL